MLCCFERAQMAPGIRWMARVATISFGCLIFRNTNSLAPRSKTIAPRCGRISRRWFCSGCWSSLQGKISASWSEQTCVQRDRNASTRRRLPGAGRILSVTVVAATPPAPFSAVTPAYAGAEYCRASMFIHARAGILGRPIESGDDGRCCGDAANPILSRHPRACGVPVCQGLDVHPRALWNTGSPDWIGR
jgi:hypothetical protein